MSHSAKDSVSNFGSRHYTTAIDWDDDHIVALHTGTDKVCSYKE